MSIIRFDELYGPEQSEMMLQMQGQDHLNIFGQFAMGQLGQICLPSGTTGQRPTNPQVGMIRINETLLAIEVYDGEAWLPITNPQGGAGSGLTTAVGQQKYGSAGTYNWECPENVYDVCVVCVGGGGGSTVNEMGAGGGAGLGWANGIVVQPGQTYQVVVGQKGTPASGGNYAGNGGTSYFIDTNTVYGGGGAGTGRSRSGSANRPGYGGQGGDYGGSGGSAQGGGNGGPGGDGNRSSLSDTGNSCGGGGAAGYTGNGGYGGHHTSSWGTGGNGSGGGGSGGYAGSSEGYGGGGGGVGLNGEGSSGSVSSSSGGAGRGGSGGNNGTGNVNQDQDVPGGDYGGGAGSNDQYGSYGGVGGVRIIWGQGREFPSTNTSDQ
tara:strand:- start:2118 stop:3248 length:1131 start_codon:yes stop_codon:yes gene_type:complete